MLAAFGEKSVELGLTPKQARPWQAGSELAKGETYEAQLGAGVAGTAQSLGQEGECQPEGSCRARFPRVDRQQRRRIFRAIGASGAANSPPSAKGLLAIAQMLSEDAMGRGGSGDMPVKPETALEGIEKRLQGNAGKIVRRFNHVLQHDDAA